MTANQIIELAYESLKGNADSLQILNDIFEENKLNRISDEDFVLIVCHKNLIEKLRKERIEDEKVAQQGYDEAFSIIIDLQNRLREIQQQYEEELATGHSELFQLLNEKYD